MAFEWQDYFTLAQALQQSPVAGLDEASKRTVVSRAYYAAHHIASNFARKSTHPPVFQSNSEDHRMSLLQKGLDKKGKSLI